MSLPTPDDTGLNPSSAGPLRILVVDDSPTGLRVAAGALERAGYCVDLASDGAEAVQLARETDPAVIVLDIVLPKANGFQVTRELRTDPRTAHQKILLLSSKSQEADRFWGLKQGADGYLTKPFDTETLVDRVAELASVSGGRRTP